LAEPIDRRINSKCPGGLPHRLEGVLHRFGHVLDTIRT